MKIYLTKKEAKALISLANKLSKALKDKERMNIAKFFRASEDFHDNIDGGIDD